MGQHFRCRISCAHLRLNFIAYRMRLLERQPRVELQMKLYKLVRA